MIPDEKLMAYVDGELDEQGRGEIERAMASDVELARRIARERSLRGVLRAAYGPALAEPVPDRLVGAVRAAAASVATTKVVPIRGPQRPAAPRWSTREWTAIAASLILGALVSGLVLHSFEGGPLSSRDGRLIARGALANSLSRQLASRQPRDAPIAIGVTFLSQTGDYCRTFAMRGRTGMAGLACRDHGAWQIEALARIEGGVSGAGTYRPAASLIPPAVLAAASTAMAGEPLDAHAEAVAQANGWRRR